MKVILPGMAVNQELIWDIALGMMEPNGFPIQNDKYLKSII